MKYMLTGQYMIGYVAVGVYLMESTGPTENWYPEAEERTFNEIVQGLDWLAEQAFERGHKLVWVYPPVEKISTGFEPITLDHVPSYSFANWVFHWLDDIYAAHGLTDEWDGAFDLANQLRHQYQTNWAVELAVVMDDNDSDYMFADSVFAYASPNCLSPFYSCDSEDRSPIVVLTYNNGGWGPYQMHKVVAHEVSHVFGASDEYDQPSHPAPQCKDEDDCGVQQSYLRAPNGNCQVCNTSSTSCYMRREYGSVCDFTPPELGWRDSDGDGASDAIDQNYARFSWFLNLNPGDIIRIYNVGGELINVYCITQDQLSGPNHAFFWNGVQHSNALSAIDRYVVTRNDSPYATYNLQSWPSIPPYSFSNHHFLRDTLWYTTPAQDFYVRNNVYDSQGELMGRPRFDVMTYHGVVTATDMSGWPDRVYTSEVSGWLPTGANAQTSTTTFVNYLCGDVDNDGSVTAGDVTFLVAMLFSGGPPPVHPSSGDVDHCTGGVTVSDLTYLVTYVFQSGPAPECCHSIP